MRIAICDDEQLFNEQLLGMIPTWAETHETSDVRVFTYTSAEDLLEDWENGKTFDALFLDIIFPYLSGFDLAARIRKTDLSIPIIFITNTERFALKGYEVSAFRYIKKPADPEEVFHCLDHCYEQTTSVMQQNFILQRRTGTIRIAYRTVLYIVSGIHSVTIYTTDGDKVTTPISVSFEAFADKFPSSHFVRCHRGYLINMLHVRRYTPSDVTMNGNHTIPIGRNFKTATLDKLHDFFLHEVQL